MWAAPADRIIETVSLTVADGRNDVTPEIGRDSRSVPYLSF
jgi:hypothetical protein